MTSSFNQPSGSRRCRVDAYQQPTIDDLENALAGARAELDELEIALSSAIAKNAEATVLMEDMAGWLGKMSAAFIRGDADKLAETVDKFIKQRVKPAMSNNGTKH